MQVCIVHHVCSWCLWRSEVSIQAPATGIIDGFELTATQEERSVNLTPRIFWEVLFLCVSVCVCVYVPLCVYMNFICEGTSRGQKRASVLLKPPCVGTGNQTWDRASTANAAKNALWLPGYF